MRGRVIGLAEQRRQAPALAQGLHHDAVAPALRHDTIEFTPDVVTSGALAKIPPHLRWLLEGLDQPHEPGRRGGRGGLGKVPHLLLKGVPPRSTCKVQTRPEFFFYGRILILGSKIWLLGVDTSLIMSVV
jgi:hypothetical protein